MKLYTVSGKQIYKNVRKYEIDWDSKSRSKFQKNVKDILFEIWQNHVVFEEFPVYGSRCSLDFFNATKNIAIECQGSQHTRFNPFFHNNNRGNFLHQIHKDEKKRMFCQLNGIKLVEIFEEDKKILNLNFIESLFNEEE